MHQSRKMLATPLFPLHYQKQPLAVIISLDSVVINSFIKTITRITQIHQPITFDYFEHQPITDNGRSVRPLCIFAEVRVFYCSYANMRRGITFRSFICDWLMFKIVERNWLMNLCGKGYRFDKTNYYKRMKRNNDCKWLFLITQLKTGMSRLTTTFFRRRNISFKANSSVCTNQGFLVLCFLTFLLSSNDICIENNLLPKSTIGIYIHT